MDAGAGVGDRVADPVGQPLDRLDEGDVLDLLHERVHVAALTAAEAVEVAVVGPDVKRRRLLVVERAQPLQRVGAGAAQLDVVADDLLDPVAFADGGDVAIGDPRAGHRVSLSAWTLANVAACSRTTSGTAGSCPVSAAVKHCVDLRRGKKDPFAGTPSRTSTLRDDAACAVPPPT